MSQTSFTAEGMTQTANRFTQGVANVKSARTTLAHQMDNLAQEWGGKASKVFDKVMKDWGAQHDIIVSELQIIADLLKKGGTQTTQTEQSVAQQALFFNGA